jgi:adenylylsulfate kinase-like enzyme
MKGKFEQANEISWSSTLWFTGLSFASEKHLIQLDIQVRGLNSEEIRQELCKDLGFSAEDRLENICRVVEVAKILTDSDFVALASPISPLRRDRDLAREVHEQFCSWNLLACFIQFN